jgi:hypothetical protein
MGAKSSAAWNQLGDNDARCAEVRLLDEFV